MSIDSIHELEKDTRMAEIGGAMGLEERMVQLNDSLDIFISAELSNIESHRQHRKAFRYIEDYELRIAGVIAHETLPDERDLDVTDELRQRVRPFVYQGLRIGHLLAKELLNG